MPRKKIIQSDESSDINGKQNTLEVKIVSNWSLLQILDDWKKVLKIIAALFVIVITVFIGLAIVTISIKRIYPYNDIKVNAFGATTMQNEETDVIYWLFNTADLWANSGIQVKAGDKLTIRASGRFHTAVHHLVKNVEANEKLTDNWVNTNGDGKKIDGRDKYRASYRIFKNENQDALIMQVVPNDIEINKLDSTKIEKYLVFENVKNDETKIGNIDRNDVSKVKNRREDFYYIGKEREDLLIYNDGVLHFAVNDIVLTKNVINSMCNENNKLIETDTTYNGTNWQKLNKTKYFSFGAYPDSLKTLTKDRNEMTYYGENHYYNAWFDDNVGSFLIVIERKRSK
jgi:hypothetical protein